MLAKINVDQILTKANLFAKRNEISEAKKLYKLILDTFPKNSRAKEALGNLNNKSNEDQLNRITKLYNEKKFSKVIKNSQNLSKKDLESYVTWNMLGTSFVQIEMIEKATHAYHQALMLNPDNEGLYINIGITFKNKGKLSEAIKVYQKVLASKPNNALAYYYIGIALQEQGKHIDAINAFNKSLVLKPNQAKVYNDIGAALITQGKIDDAVSTYYKSITLDPYYAEAYNNLGVALKNKGELDKAIQSYKKALDLKPNCEEILDNLGVALQNQGKYDDAIIVYNKVLTLNPNKASTYNNLGAALKDQGKIDKAIEVYKMALKISPKNDNVYSNLGFALQELGKTDEALKAYNKCLLLDPNNGRGHKNLSYALLNIGRIKEGLDEYEWRWKVPSMNLNERYFLKPKCLHKEDIKSKKVLIWKEQGIGDTIGWSSCLSHVITKAKKCTLECDHKLIPLFKRSFPKAKIKQENRNFDMNRNDFDIHLPMGSLYRLFIDEISQNKKSDPYLFPEPKRVKFWKKRLNMLGNGPFIGISWNSSNMSTSRLQNYAPVSAWTPVLTIPNITLINLQKSNNSENLQTIQKELKVKIHNFEDVDHYDDLLDAAALYSALDCVVATRNAIPLISAGVGTLTKLASWQQSSWNNILHNPVGPYVDIYQRDTWNTWNNVFSLIAEDIFKLAKHWQTHE